MEFIQIGEFWVNVADIVAVSPGEEQPGEQTALELEEPRAGYAVAIRDIDNAWIPAECADPVLGVLFAHDSTAKYAAIAQAVREGK